MADKVKPIRPRDVIQAKAKIIPDAVLQVFNEFIARNFDGEKAVVNQREVVQVLIERGIKETDIYDNHWLDVEGLYQATGWKVVHDKPGYCESYPPTFEFSPANNKKK